MKAAGFIAAALPNGTKTGLGRLPCPHCDELHRNPEDGSDLWTLTQVKALEAMRASRVCTRCGRPSMPSTKEDTGT